MTGIALHVHNGIDTHRMGIGTRAGADGNDLATHMLTDILVRLFHAHHSRFHFGHMDGGIVHLVGTRTIAIHKSEALGQLFEIYH